MQGKSLYVHTALIAKVSEPLERLVNGEISEAQSGQAVLQDEDEATFVRFCSWIYSGTYRAEPFAERLNSESLIAEAVKEFADDGKSCCIWILHSQLTVR